MPTFEQIKLGVYANDGTGDDLRTAFQKVNSNFTLLSTTSGIANGTNLGTGVGIFAQRNISNLEFKTLTSTNNTVNITSTSTSVDLASLTDLVTDTSPTLGGNLNLNDYYIYGGDVQTSVYGVDVPSIQGLLELLLIGNQLNLDFGSFTNPAGGNGSPNSGSDLDMNGTGNQTFSDSVNQIDLDFGGIL